MSMMMKAEVMTKIRPNDVSFKQESMTMKWTFNIFCDGFSFTRWQTKSGVLYSSPCRSHRSYSTSFCRHHATDWVFPISVSQRSRQLFCFFLFSGGSQKCLCFIIKSFPLGIRSPVSDASVRPIAGPCRPRVTLPVRLIRNVSLPPRR